MKQNRQDKLELKFLNKILTTPLNHLEIMTMLTRCNRLSTDKIGDL